MGIQRQRPRDGGPDLGGVGVWSMHVCVKYDCVCDVMVQGGRYGSREIGGVELPGELLGADTRVPRILRRVGRPARWDDGERGDAGTSPPLYLACAFCFPRAESTP